MKSKIIERVKRVLASTKGTTVSISSSTINGDFVAGSSVHITNKVTIDGNEVIDLDKIGPVTVTVNGSIANLSVTSGRVTVEGDVGACKTVSGDVDVKGMCDGDIQTVSGDVGVTGGVKGSVKTMSGDVRVG